jgi:hypothetical protein
MELMPSKINLLDLMFFLFENCAGLTETRGIARLIAVLHTPALGAKAEGVSG